MPLKTQFTCATETFNMVSCGFLCSARQCRLNCFLHFPKLRFVVLLLLVLNTQANIIKNEVEKLEQEQQQVVPVALSDRTHEVSKLDASKESNEVNKDVAQSAPEAAKLEENKVSNEVVEDSAAPIVQPEQPKVPQVASNEKVPAVPQQPAKPEGAQLPKLPVKPQSKPEKPKVKPDSQLPKLPSVPAKQYSPAAAQPQIKPAQLPNQPAQPEVPKVKPDSQLPKLPSVPAKEAKPEVPKVQADAKLPSVPAKKPQPEEAKVKPVIQLPKLPVEEPQVKPDSQLPKLPSLPAKEDSPAKPEDVKLKPELPKLPAKETLLAKPKPAASLPKLPNVVVKEESPVPAMPEEHKSKPELPQLTNIIPKEDLSVAEAAADQPEHAKPQQPQQKPVHPKFPNVVAKQEEKDNKPAEVHQEADQSIEKQKEQVLDKLNDIKEKVSNKQKAEGRIKVVFPSQVYIVDKTTSTTTTTTKKPHGSHNHEHNHEHIHDHYYYKPPLFPFLPPVFVESSGSNGYYSKYPSSSSSSNNNYYNKYGNHGSSSSSYNKYGNQGSSGYYQLPLLPIPFWKPTTYSTSGIAGTATKVNISEEDQDQLYNYKPFYAYGDNYPPIYITERRLASEEEDKPAEKQGLILIGHIFLTIKPQKVHKGQKDQQDAHAGKVTPSVEDKPEGSSPQPDIKIEEPLENAQLLLQPVAYPSISENQNIDGSNFQPQKINEIVRSLHLVHPSADQQRSQSSEEGEESSVLFAVEIPKPIYRFFKSVFGVFSY